MGSSKARLPLVVPQLHQQAALLVAGQPQVGEPLPATARVAARHRVRSAPAPGSGAPPVLPATAASTRSVSSPGGTTSGTAPLRKNQWVAAVQPGQGAVFNDDVMAVDAAVDAAYVAVVDAQVDKAAMLSLASFSRDLRSSGTSPSLASSVPTPTTSNWCGGYRSNFAKAACCLRPGHR